MAAALQAVLKRDRAVVGASLALLVLLAWAYLVHLSGTMPGMDGSMPDMTNMEGMEGMAGMGGMDMSVLAADPHAGVARYVLTAFMWIVMMVGMMLPSAAPMILLFAAVERKSAVAPLYSRTALFVLGYLVVWGGFSVLAAGLQTGLASVGLVSAGMSTTNALLGGGLFVAAGLYEFSALKRRCLAHCRSPLDFIMHHMRPGPLGALRVGIAHGVYCLGCCWVLMLLLFVGGVMNLLWVAALAAIVLAQKLLPGGEWVSRLGGLALIACGIVIAAQAP